MPAFGPYFIGLTVCKEEISFFKYSSSARLCQIHNNATAILNFYFLVYTVVMLKG